MGQFPSPDDRPDPNERSTAVRARVPDHVMAGSVSTGVIVVTGSTEFVLDFVRNLPRPSMVVTRVVLPHAVMPQFIDALNSNITIYKQRFGDLGPPAVAKSVLPVEATSQSIVSASSSAVAPDAAGGRQEAGTGQGDASATDRGSLSAGAATPETSKGSAGSGGEPPAGSSNAASVSPTPANSGSAPRQASPQEVYDELKIKDELLSGAYANAVMIGHGPHEFCFDFITNFYPQSAVSCRVYMSSGHIIRLLDSLRASWEQLRPRLGGNPPPV